MGLELSNDPKRAARQKAAHLCEIAGRLHAETNAYGKPGEISWTSKGVRFVIERSWLQNMIVQFVVSASKGGKSLPLDGANPFGFVNPPLCVVDEKGRREDPEAALRNMIEQAVLTAANNRGW